MKRLSPGGRLPGPSWGADAPPGTRTKLWGAPGRKAEKVLLPFSGPTRCSHTLALLASRPQHPSPLSALSPKPRYSPHAPVSHPKSGCSTSHLSLPTFLALPVTLGARAPGPRPFPCQERFSPSPGCSSTTTRAVCSSPSSDHFCAPQRPPPLQARDASSSYQISSSSLPFKLATLQAPSPGGPPAHPLPTLRGWRKAPKAGRFLSSTSGDLHPARAAFDPRQEKSGKPSAPQHQQGRWRCRLGRAAQAQGAARRQKGGICWCKALQI